MMTHDPVIVKIAQKRGRGLLITRANSTFPFFTLNPARGGSSKFKQGVPNPG